MRSTVTTSVAKPRPSSSATRSPRRAGERRVRHDEVLGLRRGLRLGYAGAMPGCEERRLGGGLDLAVPAAMRTGLTVAVCSPRRHVLPANCQIATA